MNRACSRIGRALNAYVDGELEPAMRHTVARHLAVCEHCQVRCEEIRHVGELVRAHAPEHSVNRDLDSLAAGVIGRVRAEEAQSWGAALRNARDDCYWAWVGAGSLASGVCTLLFVSILWGFGPQRIAEDSVAAMLDRLQTPAGTLWVIATPAGRDQLPIYMQVGAADSEHDRPTDLSSSAGDLALALSQAVLRKDGRVSGWRAMSQHDRENAETLLDEIHPRAVPAASWTDRYVSIHRLVFITNTSVFGKSL